MPWRVEGTAEAGVGWGLPGAAGLARAGMCPPAEGADGGRVGRAGSPIARGSCGSCFTCGSRVAAIPPRAAMRSHASVNALWRATSVCQSAPHMREWVAPAAMDRPQTHVYIVSVLTCEKIFAEAQACTDAELYYRELCWTRPRCEPC